MTNANDSIQPIVKPGFAYGDGSYEETAVTGGLTKREYFAALNVSAMVSSIHSEYEYQRLKKLASEQNMAVSQWIAKDGVKQADALINELNTTP